MNEMQSEVKPAAEAKTSGMAIASLVLGICGLVSCGITGIVGLILGIIGLVSIRKSTGQLKGQGLAIAGIAVSAVGIVLVPLIGFMIAILTPALVSARHQAMSVLPMNHARQLCLAMIMYADDHDGRFPPADNWPDVLAPYLAHNEKILCSPFNPEAGRAWAMNAHLAGRQRSDIDQPHQVVLVFESRFGSPPSGGRELLPEEPPEHRGFANRGYVIGFLDGHVEMVRPERLDELVWQP
jgi:hypothetical protein